MYLRARYDVKGRFLAYCGILLVVFIGSLIVALLLSSLLRRAITAPLDAMADVAQQVVEKRDFGLRARRVTDDEIGLVVNAFNKMLDEVQAHAEALERSHAAVQASVEVAKRTEKELRATEAALREADQRKDVFIATLAHELRNPLAPIRIAARLLASPGLKPAELANTRAIIARQVQHMALLLEDLLDVSRITRGALELKRDYVALDDCIAAAVETARPLIDGKRHKLIIEAAAAPIILDADPLRLTQIITNLLTNAAKYTDPDGEILLRSSVEGDRVTISVKDSGIGVPAEALPKLFEMFSQLQSAGGRSEGGLGIGLALVKGLVLLHGGEVQARSAGLNHGSEFLVRLPAVSHARGAVPLAADSATSPAARQRRILVADDNRDAAESLALLLKLAGHDVHVAYSGSEALAAAVAVSPEFILLDIGMPGLSGYEVARSLRKSGARSVLIAITGWGQDSDRAQAEEAGFDHHMTKPVDPASLEKLLN
ncbi:MAG: ATP-binding protein, partial [Acetobacteraceae bacterium]